jgi:prevent-host-death family protein
LKQSLILLLAIQTRLDHNGITIEHEVTDMQITNISEAKANLSKLVERVMRGEEVVIGKSGKPVAKLVPYSLDTSPR